VTRIRTGISNAYLVGNSDQWVLIDCGTQGYADTITEAAERRFGHDNPPECIYLTHGHFDHAGSASALAEQWGVSIFAHKLETRSSMAARNIRHPIPPSAALCRR
jgi:glyoxylase-like metal-dependent hydrolase (beta-lactamase superfamily II)